jgi:hypothetical protein
MKTTFKILKYIIFSIIGFITIAILWFSLWYWYEKGESQIVIIPNNYEGGIIILCGDKDGVPEKYNAKNERIYEIPKNGILKTKFNFQDGKRYDIKYYYKNGKEIRYLWPSDKVWADTTNVKSVYKDSIYSYNEAFGGGNLWVLIGKAKEIEINYKKLDEMSNKLPPNPVILKTGEHYGKMPDKTYFDN